jgi:hypothetical protein
MSQRLKMRCFMIGRFFIIVILIGWEGFGFVGTRMLLLFREYLVMNKCCLVEWILNS